MALRTTGLPKGVEISHYNLISNVEQLIFKRGRLGDDATGRDRAARMSECGERWLAPLPMYHAFVGYCLRVAQHLDGAIDTNWWLTVEK